jgi:hypothetical protein
MVGAMNDAPSPHLVATPALAAWGGRESEALLHKLFFAERGAGEWFSRSERLVNAIAALTRAAA